MEGLNNNNYLQLCTFLIFCTFVIYADTTNCRGCVQLDSFSFDKLISKFDASLVKFDVAYPYGDKHEEFGKASESVRDVSELLVAEVGIKDYGEKENADLADRFSIDKDDFPVLLLFTSQKKPIVYGGKWIAEDILNFVRFNSNIYVGLPGCIEEFDRLAEKFVEASDVDSKKKILRQTEDFWDTVKGASNQKSAEVYVKTMRRVLEKNDFIETELKRVENIIKGKISNEKANEMKVRLNILKSFRKDVPRDEL